ncbi:uncharacterized protein LOC130137894 [Syzygium oleosum]|uniref:uncharacterized protein LOC130137894 n=1 Tax=Syzygium oleosum TaxID=219896 RepID=UPI0024BB8D03|nr:uncharacterized protein LOC130137894 [Syzygium oleosum]
MEGISFDVEGRSHSGWLVSPQLFGDARTRLFTYWTGDGYRNGCYNVLCPGFIQVHREITPGYLAEPTSTYGGVQYELVIHIEQPNSFVLKVANFGYHSTLLKVIHISIQSQSIIASMLSDYHLLIISAFFTLLHLLSKFISNQDRNTGNWWLIVSDRKVGYWPKELFPYLRNGSLHTAWGGIGIAGSDGFCPPMGSGHMPDGVYEHATVFRRLHWVRSDGKFLPPSNKTTEWVDRSNVYGLMNHHHVRKYRSGYMISIGGPGGYCRV